MPVKLSTTIGKIENISNAINREIIKEFLIYMNKNGSSEHHQNNNLKVVIAFDNFLGKGTSFYEIKTKEQVLEFLDTKIKSYNEDPDKRWITTWKQLPTSYQISTSDHMIPPDVQQKFAKQMNATTISINASHASYVSHPDEIAKLIIDAAKGKAT